MPSGPPDSQQGSALHALECQNMLEGPTRYVHLVHWQGVSTGNRGCSDVDLKQFVLESSLVIKRVGSYAYLREGFIEYGDSMRHLGMLDVRKVFGTG